MKTLLVLSALAAVALAAPAPSDNGYVLNQVPATEDKVLATIKREKKSITDALEKEATHEADLPSLHSEDSIAETSARTFGKKKPIIVKKNHGYHLYRDSAEEQAQEDYQEKCRKEVKVKLCDAGNNLKPSAKSTIEDVDDMDMEHSIKMAKEAVENLQKGLKDMEHDTNAKMAQWKHTDGTKDAEIHADIEVARQALEHIHQNFGNLESMNLRATTLKDAEALEDAQKKITNPDDQRMAQWKEAIENIQKNVEIARNIEDSFKTDSHQEKNTHETSMKTNNGLNLNKHEEFNEMTVSASEPKESKLELQTVNVKEKSATTNIVTQSKSEEIPVNTHSVEMKINEMPKEGKTAELPSSSHASRNIIGEKLTTADLHMLQMIDSLTAQGLQTPKSTDNLEHNKDRAIKESEGDLTDMHLKKEKSALKENKDKKMLPKSNENIAIVDSNKKLESEPNMELKSPVSLKSVEHLDKEQDWKNSHHKNGAQVAVSMKSADQETHQSQQVNSLTPHMESFEPTHPQHQTAVTMKASEHEHTSSSLLHNHSENMLPSTAGPQVNSEKQLNTMQRNSHFAEQTHQPSSSHVDVPTGHPISKTHENMMTHGKSADMDSAVQATSQINTKDTSGKMALEQNNMLQWKQHQGAARGAYGPGAYGAAASGLSLGAAAAGGPGAIGVFPKGHVGRCAIPLLLSCSPKVVSGSLAEAHSPAYGAASAAGAYRAGEDLKFHRKRDILTDVSGTKVRRTPTKVIQKILNNLDKKL